MTEANRDRLPSVQSLASEDDEEIRRAKAMAKAFAANPNLTPEEVHKLVEQQPDLLVPSRVVTSSVLDPPRARTNSRTFRIFNNINKTGSSDEEGLANSSSSHMRLFRQSVKSPRSPPMDATVTAELPTERNDPPIRLTGIAWKRRGGMGKYSTTSAWERRRVELQGNQLLYYSNDQDEIASVPSKESLMEEDGIVVSRRSTWLEQAAANFTTPTTDGVGPRGALDLLKEKATVHAAFGHSGAPSPFAVSIKVRGETKWKLCFDYHKEQMEWLAALTDVVVQNSVDCYNQALLENADPRYADEASQLKEPPLASGEASTSHRLWMTGTYTISNENLLERLGMGSEDEDDLDLDDDTFADDGFATELLTPREASTPRTTNVGPPAAVIAAPPSLDWDEVLDQVGKTLSLPEKSMTLFWIVMNAAVAYGRNSSMDGFWYTVVILNMAFIGSIVRIPVWSELVKAGEDAMAAAKPRASGKQKTARRTGKKAATAATPVRVSSFIPIAGSSTVKIVNPTDPPVNSKNEVFGGWRAPPGDTLMIRSQGYSTTKKKIPSPGELYECVACDIFEAPTTYPDMSPRVKLPEIKFEDSGPKTWRCPDLFVISIALPTDPPKLGRSSSDGGGYTVTMYYAMKQETREILKRVTAEDYDPSTEEIDDPQKSQINAVKLLEEWIRRAPDDPKWFSRFKVVPNAHNLKEIGMPGWISKYNGKPFLIKRPGVTGFIHNHPELSCFEFDITLHPFPYLAKQGICFMKDSYFKKVLVTFGFVIEGKTDDELPECLIGCMQLCYPDPVFAIQAKDFFSGASPKSYE